MGQPQTAWITTDAGHILNLSMWEHVVVQADPANAGKFRVVAVMGQHANPTNFCTIRENLTQVAANALIGAIATMMGSTAV